MRDGSAEEAGSARDCRSSLGAASPRLADGEGGVAPRPSRRVGDGQIRLEEFVVGGAAVSDRDGYPQSHPQPAEPVVGWVDKHTGKPGPGARGSTQNRPKGHRVRSDAVAGSKAVKALSGTNAPLADFT